MWLPKVILSEDKICKQLVNIQKKKKMKGEIVQVLSTLVVVIGNFTFAFMVSWSSYALETFSGPESPFGYPITKTQGGLIGSIPMLGSFFTAMLSGWLTDIFGRKKTIILSSIVFTVGWSIIIAATNVTTVIIGRLILGIAAGIHIVSSTAFISEISQMSMQGTTTSLTGLLYSSGTVVSYLSGWLLGYKIGNYFIMSLCVLLGVLMILLKESPPYLIARGEDKEGMLSLQFYRGVSKATPDVLDEMAYMKKQDNSHKECCHETSELTTKDSNYIIVEMSPWQTLRASKSNQRALVTTILFIVLQVFGGTIAVVAYAGPLFMEAAPGLSPHLCSIAISIAFTVGGLLATIISGMLLRRVLMMTSAVLSAMFLAIVASLLRWHWGPQWLVPISLLGYCCCFQVGVSSVPYIQMSETFPPKLKPLASVIATCCMCVANFIVLALFSPLVSLCGLDGTFFVFSLLCGLTAVLAFIFMKETKGRRQEEILEMYSRGYLNTHNNKEGLK